MVHVAPSGEAESGGQAPLAKHTPGPWPMVPTGDGKRIEIGPGLVEGPNGYEVAEVYSDDCPWELAEANARLIAAAPELLSGALALDQLVEEMQVNVSAYLMPNGLTESQLIDKLVYLLDGPEQRAAQLPLRAAIAKALGK